MKRLAIVWLLVLSLSAAPALAQGPDAQQLYTKLYCPLCGGVRLDACVLQVCEEMRSEIQQKLAAGQSEQQIIAYYRVRWGDQVLGYPPAEGINLLPWLVPFALVAGGGLALWRMARGWTRGQAMTRAEGSAAVPPSPETTARIEREIYE